MPNFQLTPDEIELFRVLPEDMMLDLCRDLDMILPETVDKIPLVIDMIPVFLSHAQRKGLPFHSINRLTLSELTERELQILADICRVKPSIRAILKHGARVYKTIHEKGTRYHAIRLNMITFLKPMLRYHAQHS